jgi:hypothetical protein
LCDHWSSHGGSYAGSGGEYVLAPKSFGTLVESMNPA